MNAGRRLDNSVVQMSSAQLQKSLKHGFPERGYQSCETNLGKPLGFRRQSSEEKRRSLRSLKLKCSAEEGQEWPAQKKYCPMMQRCRIELRS